MPQSSVSLQIQCRLKFCSIRPDRPRGQVSTISVCRNTIFKCGVLCTCAMRIDNENDVVVKMFVHTCAEGKLRSDGSFVQRRLSESESKLSAERNSGVIGESFTPVEQLELYVPHSRTSIAFTVSFRFRFVL